MKNLLVFILILLSKILNACGYYPYGEDVRISLFNPSIYGYDTYANFHYSANLFSADEKTLPKEFVLANNTLWFKYCKGKVDLPEIDVAVYHHSASDIHEQSQNLMIQYLYKQKDQEAINYLRFAKSIEFFNSWQDDPWERNADMAETKRTDLINRSIALASKVENKEIRKRYTFLAIRLAWYNNQFEKIDSLFASVFENTAEKDILYYWSLYFKSFTESNKAKANFELAQVFANAVDKRFACHLHFNSKSSIKEALLFAQTDIERANVYLLYGIEKQDKALQYLQEMYSLNPSLDGLSFLMLREINKIEDYVFTPYYTLFEPSTIYNRWTDHNDNATRITLERSENDRLYAKELLNFIISVDLQKVENPFLWKCSAAYLQFITRDYSACLRLINQLEKSTSDKKILNQLQKIKALALIANQDKGKAIIPLDVQTTIIENQKNGQFVFAIGKELEYLGNTSDAALLFATLDNSWEETTPVAWKPLNSKKQTGVDYFVDFYDYMDAVYTPEQTQLLIDDILKNKDNTDSFSVFKYENVKNDITRLYDLLGTKYIRQNKLEKALEAFSKVNNAYWSRTYGAWSERNYIFNQNPFYTLRYTPEFITQKDTIRLNKYTITQQLITYLLKAEDKNEKDRDYYYFLVANAYYNMGSSGNVYIMRRLNSWSGYYLSVIEDEAEFRQSLLAKKYYLLAKQHAKTEKFKALCLRMIIGCEEKRLAFRYLEDDNFYSRKNHSNLADNPYYKELKNNYSGYFNDLTSNCDNFKNYFEARR